MTNVIPFILFELVFPLQRTECNQIQYMCNMLVAVAYLIAISIMIIVTKSELTCKSIVNIVVSSMKYSELYNKQQTYYDIEVI